MSVLRIILSCALYVCQSSKSKRTSKRSKRTMEKPIDLGPLVRIMIIFAVLQPPLKKQKRKIVIKKMSPSEFAIH